MLRRRDICTATAAPWGSCRLKKPRAAHLTCLRQILTGKCADIHASDLPKQRLVSGDRRYSPNSGMRE
jgi:hypothetical protein